MISVEIHLYILLFIIGLVVFLLSISKNEYDLTNTYQVELSLLSLVIWVAVALSSFNIELYSNTLSKIQIYDYGYIGISTGFFIVSFLNTVVLLFYGSFNAIFRGYFGRGNGGNGGNNG